MGQVSLSKKGSQKVVSEARSTAFEEVYKELGTKSGEQKIYGIAKIKDEEGNVLVTDENIKDIWKNYFYKLFNDRDETLNYDLDDLEISERNINFTCDHKIRVSEVEGDRKSTRLNSSHSGESRMPSSA